MSSTMSVSLPLGVMYTLNCVGMVLLIAMGFDDHLLIPVGEVHCQNGVYINVKTGEALGLHGQPFACRDSINQH